MEKRQNIRGYKPSFKRKPDAQMVFGKRAIIETLEAGKPIEKIYLQKDGKGDLFDEIKEKAKVRNVSISLVPVEKLNRITRKNHQGAVAQLSLIEFSSLHHVVSKCFDEGRDPLILILDHITDVRNMGAIARSAECAGVDAIVLPTKGGGQINSDAMKTSAGALNYIPICKEANLYESCRYLKNSGLQIVACTEKGDINYFDADLNSPTCIIMGSEEDGISNQLLKISDKLIKIPMKGKIASLNVANAATVVLFETLKQRLS